MSTRSRIGIEIEKGKYKHIYCHFDGYPENNGVLLIDNYKDRDKIEKLINLGDISYLAENVEPDPNYEHSFDGKKQEGIVLAYGRDRGETDIDAQIGSLKDMAGGWIEYIYVYSLDNKWLYADTYYKPLKLKDLKTKVDKIKEEE
jgi:hypothetical protein